MKIKIILLGCILLFLYSVLFYTGVRTLGAILFDGFDQPTNYFGSEFVIDAGGALLSLLLIIVLHIQINRIVKKISCKKQ